MPWARYQRLPWMLVVMYMCFTEVLSHGIEGEVVLHRVIDMEMLYEAEAMAASLVLLFSVPLL